MIINEKNVARKHQSQGGFIPNFGVNKFGVLPLLVKTMAKFLHEYTYKCCGLFSIKNMQRGRQQDIFAARGDVTQFRHRKVRWDGLMFSK